MLAHAHTHVRSLAGRCWDPRKRRWLCQTGFAHSTWGCVALVGCFLAPHVTLRPAGSSKQPSLFHVVTPSLPPLQSSCNAGRRPCWHSAVRCAGRKPARCEGRDRDCLDRRTVYACVVWSLNRLWSLVGVWQCASMRPVRNEGPLVSPIFTFIDGGGSSAILRSGLFGQLGSDRHPCHSSANALLPFTAPAIRSVL